MGERRVVAERVVGAPADEVYGYIADYREHHHRFLPPAFTDFVVEEGGRGAGTVVRFRLTVGGRGREYRAVVAEPEPGRVLTEADAGTGSTTTFTVTPAGAESRVRVETTWPGAGGLAGVMERVLARRLLGRLYADELERLDRYARERGGA